MHFRSALELSNIDLWNINLLDTHLDLLDTDIPTKYFVCLHNVFKTSSRHIFKSSSRHTFKKSSRHVFKTSSRHVFKTSSRHVFKTSSRHFQDVFSVTIFCLPRRLKDVFARRLQDVLEELLGRRLQNQQMFEGKAL